MTRELVIEILALVGVVLSAFRCGMSGNTTHGDGFFAYAALTGLLLVLLAVARVSA